MHTFLSEWTKLMSTKAIYWTTALFLFFGMGFAAIYGLDVPEDPVVLALTGMKLRLIRAHSVVVGVAGVSMFVLIIQAIMVVTGEYRHNYQSVTFLITPNRSKVVVTKWLLYSLFGAVLTFITVVLSFYMTKQVAGSEISPSLMVWSDDSARHIMWGYPLAAVLLVTLSQGVSWLLRQTAGAIALMGVWFLALENLLGLLPKVGEYISKYGPMKNLNAFLMKTPIADIPWGLNGSIVYFAVWAFAIFIAGAVMVKVRDA